MMCPGNLPHPCETAAAVAARTRRENRGTPAIGCSGLLLAGAGLLTGHCTASRLAPILPAASPPSSMAPVFPFGWQVKGQAGNIATSFACPPGEASQQLNPGKDGLLTQDNNYQTIKQSFCSMKLCVFRTGSALLSACCLSFINCFLSLCSGSFPLTSI